MVRSIVTYGLRRQNEFENRVNGVGQELSYVGIIRAEKVCHIVTLEALLD